MILSSNAKYNLTRMILNQLKLQLLQGRGRAELGVNVVGANLVVDLVGPVDQGEFVLVHTVLQNEVERVYYSTTSTFIAVKHHHLLASLASSSSSIVRVSSVTSWAMLPSVMWNTG